MSTATLDRPAVARTTADDGPIPFGRLVRTEIRKATDTRAGFWLLAGIAALTVLVVVLILLTGDTSDHDLSDVLSGAVQPAALLLPVAGVLLVSSEWSQRTNVVTFALVPLRGRVLAAKFAAGVVMAVVAVLACRLLSELAVLIDGGHQNVSLGLLGQDLLYVATGMIGGVAFGAVFLASAPAIVLNFLLPTIGAALGALTVFDGVSPWLDTTQALDPMTDGLMSATEWAHAGTALALWMVVPVLIGIRRVLRADVG